MEQRYRREQSRIQRKLEKQRRRRWSAGKLAFTIHDASNFNHNHDDRTSATTTPTGDQSSEGMVQDVTTSGQLYEADGFGADSALQSQTPSCNCCECYDIITHTARNNHDNDHDHDHHDHQNYHAGDEAVRGAAAMELVLEGDRLGMDPALQPSSKCIWRATWCSHGVYNNTHSNAHIIRNHTIVCIAHNHSNVGLFPCDNKILPSLKCRPLGCMVTPCLRPRGTPTASWNIRVEPRGWLSWAVALPLYPFTGQLVPRSTCCREPVNRSNMLRLLHPINSSILSSGCVLHSY